MRSETSTAKSDLIYEVAMKRYFSQTGEMLFDIEYHCTVESESGYIIDLSGLPVCRRYGFCAGDFVELLFLHVKWQTRPAWLFRAAAYAGENLFPERTLYVDERNIPSKVTEKRK